MKEGTWEDGKFVNVVNTTSPRSFSDDIKIRLRTLQEIVKEGLITKEDAARKRKELLEKL